MSSDNASIDMPVFTVRTLAWLRTSWLKGISRITARVLILVGLAMGLCSMTGDREPLSRSLKPVTGAGTALFLSRWPDREPAWPRGDCGADPSLPLLFVRDR